MSNRVASLIAVLAAVAFVASLVFGWPIYRVWQQGLSGQALLREAEYSRQVAVLEAQAKYESAKSLAQAEVERAKGVAEANRIIGEGLKGHHEYLVYLWIQELANSGHVIYVPTEAGLPILEAGRLNSILKGEK